MEGDEITESVIALLRQRPDVAEQMREAIVGVYHTTLPGSDPMPMLATMMQTGLLTVIEMICHNAPLTEETTEGWNRIREEIKNVDWQRVVLSLLPNAINGAT